MQTIELSAKKRDMGSKGTLRLLRQSGQIPAIIYGGEKEPFSLSVEAKPFFQLLKAHGVNILLKLKVDSSADTVLVKEVQRDPISRQLIHVDFQRISLTEKIEVSVPLHIQGEAPGVKLSGGILEHILREVRARCLPTDIPAALSVDVSQLEINQGLRIKDIVLPQGVEVLTDPEQLVVNIVAPSILEEPAAGPAAGPASTEPEVIAKGKKPEEGAEAGAAPAGKDAKAAPAKEAKKEGK